MTDRTTIEVDTETRNRLRVWKAEQGVTYAEAIEQLLDGHGHELEIDEPAEDATAILDGLEIPAMSESAAEAKKKELLRLYDALRERGEMTTASMKELVDLDGTGHDNADSFWINVISKPATNPLGALPGVEAPTRGGNIWRYEPVD